jgi:uncharacterized protein YcbK (DUF882 family)
MPVTNRDARTERRDPKPGRTRGAKLVLRRIGSLAGLTALLLILSAGQPRVVGAFGSTRTISLYHIHTQETLTVTYKKDGKYVPEALKKLNWILRDWRLNEQTEMDPKTIDLLWEMHTELGSKEPVNIICGFRSEKTNNMLRRTVGGQAKGSYHIKGQAIDATFPDVSLKQMRYSALIRERGGVGYYPTSGIPFVHVDSGPVRAWPRVPRYELALLFPSGETQHKPDSGGSLTKDDVRVARSRYQELAAQVAAFFDVRNRIKTPTEIAAAELGTPQAKTPATQVANRPAESSVVVAVDENLPKLVGTPRLVREVKTPSEAERGELNKLVTLASLTTPAAEHPSPPAADRARLSALASLDPSPQASKPVEAAQEFAPEKPTQVASLGEVVPTSSGAPAAKAGWAPAPQFDEDHPEELSYRPFPIGPMLTQSESADDTALVKLSHPNLARTLDLLEDAPVVLPMRLRPGRQVSEVLWAQQFRGEAVDVSVLSEDSDPAQDAPSDLASRPVRTTAR